MYPLVFFRVCSQICADSGTMKFINFADDTTLITNLNNEDMRNESLNYELAHFHNYLKANKLSLNVNETKAMVFHIPQKRIQLPLIKIAGEDIASIYTIIRHKSVDVRKLQVVILARSFREMSLTDRILPRHILSRVRVSVRPRIFLYAKKNQTSRPLTDRPGRMLQRHRPSELRNLKGSLYLHPRWRLTSQFTQNVRDGYAG